MLFKKGQRCKDVRYLLQTCRSSAVCAGSLARAHQQQHPAERERGLL